MNIKYDFCLTPAYCIYNGVAVLEQEGACIRFLITDVGNEVLRGRLSRAFERYVDGVRKIAECPASFRNLIKIDFEKGSRERLKKCVSQLYRAETGVVAAEESEEVLKTQREAAAVLLLDSILNEARTRGATDIHIEGNCVRLRINGRLEELLVLQNEKSIELVQRIKLLAGLNVIEKRRCQDGHFVYGNKNPFFLRVSTMAIIGRKFSGEESLVMRLLDASRIPLCVEELGFNVNQIEVLCGNEGLISLSSGLVLVCGPTGAGKSTTVASLLVEIEKAANGSLKIISLEDPPEYVIPGVTQIKVDERNGFSDALNHIFRQDPDVIMIGEIRDEESAAAALRASLTGHLVFATLHAGCASEAVFRLENLGVDRRLLCQVLRGVICQELNELGGRMKLYADIALSKEKFSREAAVADSEDVLEGLFEHFTNYEEVLRESLKVMKGNQKNRRRKFPLYGRRQEYAGIHKGVV